MSTIRLLLPLILALTTCWASNPIFDAVPPRFVKESLDDLPNFRLPGDIKPVAYNITLAPVFISNDKNFTFTGTAVIDLSIVNSTNKVTFHAKDLDIIYAELINPLSNVSINIIEKIIDEQRDFVTLILEDKLNDTSLIKLTLDFNGILNNDLRGFYRSSYKTKNGETVWLGTTHFEPVGARQAFPCWDEPKMKATFDITIITPKKTSENPVEYHAISNMKINKTRSSENRTVFNTSPIMSPYLVAFVVSNYKNNTNKDDFTVWTKPDAIDSTEFALNIGQRVLKALENYTQIEYKRDQGMEKIDQISIPDFSAGAMENWGLVTYRETGLLYTENKTTTESKQNIATTIAHEFAHQWFGNLVTCAWWDYIWLNEGFATFFQYFITEKVMLNMGEDWRLMEQFAIKNLQASAFVADASSRTRALNPKVSVKTPDQISSLFDDIAYKKGASVIRMMQYMVSDDVFQAGLNNYLTRHAFEPVNSDDLFEAIQNVITAAPFEDINLTTVMKNWVKEPGYPVVSVTRNGSNLSLRQNRFFLVQPTNPDTTEWYIPINYVTQDAANEVQGPLLLKPGEQLNITNVTNADHWILFNKDQIGYYRVNYDDANWGYLAKYLKSDNYENITKVNRAQLIDDALNLARGGYLNYNVAMTITEYLAQETDYIPWYAAIRAFNYLDNVLQEKEAKENFHKYVAGKIAAFAQFVGYEDAYNGTHVQKLAKVLALNTACKYGDEACNKFARAELDAYLYLEKKLPTDLRRGILCAGLRTANNENNANKTLQKVQEKYKNTTDEVEKGDILSGLGCITSEEYINQFLESTLKTDLLFNALNSVCTGNVASFDILFKFILQHIEEIQNKDLNALIAHLNKLANIITTKEQYIQITTLVARLSLEETQEASINVGLTNALENIAWVQHHREEVVKWIIDVVGNKPEPEPEPEPKPEPDSANSLTLTSFLVIIPLLLTRL